MSDSEHCHICGKEFDRADDPVGSENCGGDCLRCMAEAGDTDCIASLRANSRSEGD